MNKGLPPGLELLDPTASSRMPGADISPRLKGVEGKSVGMLDNGKPNFDLLLSALEEMLLDRYPSTSVTRRRKPTVAAGAPDAMKEELLRCDSVITGLGD